MQNLNFNKIGMHIKAIKLKNFKKFTGEGEFEIKFPADLTVIKAPNESGKSTIVSAVAAGLFLNPKTAKAKTFQSWQSEKLPEISIIFEDNGENFELYKNFETKESWLKNLSTNESIANFEEIHKKIKEILGFIDEEIFENVFSVKQDAFYKLDKNEETLQAALENLVGGSSKRSVSDIVSVFDKEITEIKKQSLKGGGRLQKIKGELAKIDETLSGFEAKHSRFEKLSDDLSKNAGVLKDIEDFLAYNKQKTKLSAEEMNFKKELDRIDDSLEKLEEASKSLLELDKELSEFKDLEKENVEELKDGIKELENKVSFKKLSDEIGFSKFVKKNYNWLKYSIGFLAVLSLGLSWFVPYLLVLSAALFIFLFFTYKTSKTRQLSLAVKELEAVLERFGVKSADDIYRKIKEFQLILSEKSKQEHLFLRLGGQDELSKLKESRKTLLRQLNALDLKIHDLGIDVLDDQEALKRLMREVENKDREREELKNEIAKIQGELNWLNFSEEEKINLEEKRIDLSTELEWWQKKLKILETAKELLLKARENTLLSIKDRLVDYVSQFLSIISGGKYKKITLDQEFNFKVFSDEKGAEVVPEKELSRGAIDQFYLTIRFAFAKVLCGNKRCFMLLDDPFHNFDEERKLNTKRLLQDLTSDFQVVLFTHSKEYDDWGSVVKI